MRRRSLNPTRTTLVVLIAVCIGGAGRAQAAIQLDTPFPVEKRPVGVTVTSDEGAPVDGAVITVTYRPGSSVEAQEEIGSTSAGGKLDWTPQTAGIATLAASWTAADGEEATATINVSVKFASAPIRGLLIMIFAGAVLIVGSVIRITKLLRHPEFH